MPKINSAHLDPEAQANVELLTANMGNLKAKDAAFAGDLLKQLATKHWLSDKQLYWVGILAQRASQPQAPEKRAVKIGDMAGLIELFNKAKAHIKYPALELRLSDDTRVRLTLNSSAAKFPGHITVSAYFDAGFKTWAGRVSPDGEWTQPSNATGLAAIGYLLKRMSCDPVNTAKDYAKLTNNCCFCGQLLTDPASVEVGYGPICADHWGLPWGVKK